MEKSKSVIPWKSLLAILGLFALVFCGMFLWTPLRVAYYTGRLIGEDIGKSADAVDKLLAIGEKGRNAIIANCPLRILGRQLAKFI